MLEEAKSSGKENDQSTLSMIATKKAEHATAIAAQDSRISDARKKVTTLTSEVRAPHAALEDRIAAAQKVIDERKQEHGKAESAVATLQGNVKQAGDKAVKDFEGVAAKNNPKVLHEISVEAAGKAGGEVGAHIVEHHLEKYVKPESTQSVLKDLLKQVSKNNGGGSESGH